MKKEYTVAIKVDVDRDKLNEKLEKISQLVDELNQEISSIPKLFSARQIKN